MRARHEFSPNHPHQLRSKLDSKRALIERLAHDRSQWKRRYVSAMHEINEKNQTIAQLSKQLDEVNLKLEWAHQQRQSEPMQLDVQMRDPNCSGRPDESTHILGKNHIPIEAPGCSPTYLDTHDTEDMVEFEMDSVPIAEESLELPERSGESPSQAQNLEDVSHRNDPPTKPSNKTSAKSMLDTPMPSTGLQSPPSTDLGLIRPRFPPSSRPKLGGFKYHETVRSKESRRSMHGTDCPCCQQWYQVTGIDPGMKKSHQNAVSRHRNLFAPPPGTPEDFWDIGFPDTLKSVSD
jgi:hypothetical protein